MIGKCPHCGIELKAPPFNGRETNEVMIVLTYRRLIETGVQIEPVKSSGSCPVCRATIKDFEEQKITNI